MKIIKVNNCGDCNHSFSLGIFELDKNAPTSDEPNKIYTGKDKYYCNLKWDKNGDPTFIAIGNEFDEDIIIPDWCPLKDYKGK